MPEDVGAVVEKFVRSAGQVSDDDPHFDRRVDLIEMGYLDSVGVVELLAYVAAEFGLGIDEETWAVMDPLSIDQVAATIRAGRDAA